MDPIFDLRVTDYGDPDVVALVARVQQEYVERYGSPDEGPVDVDGFRPPAGLFLLGCLDGEPIATGAWRRSPVRALDRGNAAEIKRMYVVPEHRCRGWSRVVLAELERTAVAAGHDLLVLETGSLQPEAIGLYTSSGYASIPAFGHYRDDPLSRCFGKPVGTTADLPVTPRT